MTIHVSFPESRLVKVHVSGVMLRAKVDAAKHRMHDHMQVHGKCALLFVLDPGFSNLEALVRWEVIDVDVYIKHHVVHIYI